VGRILAYMGKSPASGPGSPPGTAACRNLFVGELAQQCDALAEFLDIAAVDISVTKTA
jgi:hypothetical protein